MSRAAGNQSTRIHSSLVPSKSKAAGRQWAMTRPISLCRSVYATPVGARLCQLENPSYAAGRHDSTKARERPSETDKPLMPHLHRSLRFRKTKKAQLSLLDKATVIGVINRSQGGQNREAIVASRISQLSQCDGRRVKREKPCGAACFRQLFSW